MIRGHCDILVPTGSVLKRRTEDWKTEGLRVRRMFAWCGNEIVKWHRRRCGHKKSKRKVRCGKRNVWGYSAICGKGAMLDRMVKKTRYGSRQRRIKWRVSVEREYRFRIISVLIRVSVSISVFFSCRLSFCLQSTVTVVNVSWHREEIRGNNFCDELH